VAPVPVPGPWPVDAPWEAEEGTAGAPVPAGAGCVSAALWGGDPGDAGAPGGLAWPFAFAVPVGVLRCPEAGGADGLGDVAGVGAVVVEVAAGEVRPVGADALARPGADEAEPPPDAAPDVEGGPVVPAAPDPAAGT
jgi:hypothetical protein